MLRADRMAETAVTVLSFVAGLPRLVGYATRRLGFVGGGTAGVVYQLEQVGSGWP